MVFLGRFLVDLPIKCLEFSIGETIGVYFAIFRHEECKSLAANMGH